MNKYKISAKTCIGHINLKIIDVEFYNHKPGKLIWMVY